MPNTNTTDKILNGSEWVSTLQQLERVRTGLRKPGSAITILEREHLRSEAVRLRELLPAVVLLAVQSRLNTDQPLVASAAGARCGACYIAMPLGDHTAVLAGEKIVPCHFCGVLLFADDAERCRVLDLRESRQKRTDRRR